MLRFASLSSGSKGNCLAVEADGSRLLLDCGLSVRETERRLARLGLTPTDIDAMVVTHEHDDHVGGVFAFAAQHRVPVWLTHGTYQAVRAQAKHLEQVDVHIVQPEVAFSVGALLVTPFTVPHDAREPVQYVITDGAAKLGVLTDLGTPTTHVEMHLTGCDALVLEANHDLDLLWASAYPRWLKERVSGPFGHLNNEQAARLLSGLVHARLKHVIGAHLSQQNNQPELVRVAFSQALGCTPEEVVLATQDAGFDWRSAS